MLTITVDTLDDEIDGSITDGDISLRDAIAAASPGETINFSVTGTIQLSTLGVGSVLIDKPLTIQGPGAGNLTIRSDQLHRVFSVTDDSASLIDVSIHDVTISNGMPLELPGNAAILSAGGGILSLENLVVTDVVITDNDATAGGGIASVAGTLTIENSTISGNHTFGFASRRGGGVYSGPDAGLLMIRDSVISGNSARDGGGVGVRNEALIETTDITGNDATTGGGIESFDGKLTIVDSLIESNTAVGSGGGIAARYGNPIVDPGPRGLVVTGSTLRSNVSAVGGGLYSDRIDVSVERTTISGNSVTGFGGGVYLSQAFGQGTVTGPAEFTNSTISGNTADGNGGGVVSTYREVLLHHTTVTLNSADDDSNGTGAGGGLLSNGVSIALDHAIVAGNLAPTSPDANNVLARFSLIGDTTGVTIDDFGGNQLNALAMLGPLTNNGGTSETHALLSGSAAINTGNPAFVPPPSTDQTGASRVFLDRVDIGSVEFTDLPTGPFVVDSSDDEVDYDLTAGEFSLREAILIANLNPGADSISFAPSMSGEAISLALGQLDITDDLTIQGPGSSLLTIDGGGLSRVFDVNDGSTGSLADVEIADLTITGGAALGLGLAGDGGGILSRESLTLQRVTVSNNFAARLGGGINSTAGELFIYESTIDGNESARSGGGVTSRGVAVVEDSTISNNNSERGGGGWYALEGSLDMTSSTVSGNSALDEGGGVSLEVAATFTHSTITQNVSDSDDNATGTGGGLYADMGATLIHTIVAGNKDISGTANDLSQNSGFFDAEFSLIGDDGNAVFNNASGSLIGTPSATIDARLAPLADNGGPTYTHLPTVASPAVNAGDPSFSPPPNNDQRGVGFPREAFGTIDIGAVEFNEIVPSMIVVDVAEDVVNADLSAGDLSLREAVLMANLSPGINTISFDTSLSGETLLLEDGELAIATSVVIQGLGANELTIDAGGDSRHFNIDDTTAGLISVDISGLQLIGGAVSGSGDDGRGGSILSREQLFIIDSVFANNSAPGDGGAIASLAESVTIEDTLIENNIAGGRGGGVVGDGITAILSSSLASNDAAAGGGLAITGGTATVFNSTISGKNTLALGVLFYTRAGTTIEHTTITLNTADSDDSGSGSGGGIYSRGAIVDLDHTLVANNFDLNKVSPDLGGNSPQFRTEFSLIGDNTGSTIVDLGGNQIGTAIAPIDPMLGPLADNGGPTRTHKPLPDSPVIEAGNSAISSAPTFDQRGTPFARISDGDRNGLAIIDVGAVEVDTFIVDTLADESDGDISFGDLSLREAIERANLTGFAEVIEFAPSLYGGVIELSLGELQITDSITIRGPGSDLLTIDGLGGTRLIDIGDADFLTAFDVQIEGLRLTGGAANDGGAIRTNENLTLVDSLLTGNSATDDGGALFAVHYGGGETHLVGVTVSSNTADDDGGGLSSLFGVLRLTDSTVTGNQADGDGGGVHSNRDVVLNGSNIAQNSAVGSGGGLYVSYGEVAVSDSTITGNDATGAGEDGGGIAVSNATLLRIERSEVTGNDAADGGGGIVASSTPVEVIDSTLDGNNALGGSGGALRTTGATMTIRSSTLSNNTASFGGGAIANEGTTDTTIVQSTISGNTAGRFGGGVYSNGALTLRHSTITDNEAGGTYATARGGGIQGVLGTAVIDHTIVAGNRDTGIAPDFDSGFVGVTLDAEWSLLGNDMGATINDLGNNILGTTGSPIDPGLSPLGDNGGGILTHALLPTSPAVDAGDTGFDPLAFTPPLDVDQRGVGFARVVDGDLDGAASIDLGAVERVPLKVDNALDESDGDYSAGDLSLREAIELTNATPGHKDILFADDLSGSTIELVLGQLPITSSMTLHGPGADLLTIDAMGDSRIFGIAAAGLLDVEIIGLTLTGGSFAGSGGLIFIDDEALTLREVVLSNSSAIDGGAIGGTLFGADAKLEIYNSTIHDNTATDEGGALRIAGGSGATMLIENSTISGNESNGNGGGLFFFAITTFDVDIRFSTITDNLSDADSNGAGAGGGIATQLSPTVTLDHTILGGNDTGGAPGPDASGSLSARFSLISDTSGLTLTDLGNNTTDEAALLGELADNGGPTPTHKPLADSPAISGGDVSAVPGVGDTPLYDQRGAPFIRTDGSKDIGAFEKRVLNVTVFDDEDDGDYSPDDLSLREAIWIANAETQHDDISIGVVAIHLSLGELVVTDSLTIDGGVGQTRVISAGFGSRIFRVDTLAGSLPNVELQRLILREGASGNGGAIYSEGDLTLDRVVISSSVASQNGGAIYSTGALTRVDPSVSENAAAGDGGGIYHAPAIASAATQLSLRDSTIAHNGAEGDGGGIWTNGQHTLLQSTVSGNSAMGAGGGVWSHDRSGGASVIYHSTITENTSDIDADGQGAGGGLYSYEATPGAGLVALSNTILAGNSDLSGVAPDWRTPLSGSAPQASYSLIGDNTGSTLGSAPVGAPDANGNLVGKPSVEVIDPLLSPIQIRQSGSSPRLDVYGAHLLLSASPAVDAGDPAFDSNTFDPVLIRDAISGIRVRDGSRDGAAIVDIGAIELQPLVVDTLDDTSDSDYSLGELSLREALFLQSNYSTGDPITIDDSLHEGVIQTAGFILFENARIEGPGADLLTIEQVGVGSVFELQDTTSTPTEISGLRITGGNGVPRGGGIYSRGPLILTSVEIIGNSADRGGGVYLDDARLSEVRDSLISGNAATNSGGGIYAETNGSPFSNLLITGSTLHNNTSGNDGGGAFLIGPATIVTTTISGNEAADDAGGLWIESSLFFVSRLVTIEHSTITDNRAVTGDGGGLFTFGTYPNVELSHSIFAGNFADAGTLPDLRALSIPNVLQRTVSIANSLVGFADSQTYVDDGGNQVGASAASLIDPVLGPLANNGGPTLTHALMSGSPALDAGGVGLAVGAGAPETDQRGLSRVADGGVNGVRIDLGAFEAQGTPPLLPGDYTQNGAVDLSDYTVWRETLGSMVSAYAGADGNGDRLVDSLDYILWRDNFGQMLPPPPSTFVTAGLVVAEPTDVEPLFVSAEQQTAQNVTSRAAAFAILGTDSAVRAAQSAPQPPGFADVAEPVDPDLLLLIDQHADARADEQIEAFVEEEEGFNPSTTQGTADEDRGWEAFAQEMPFGLRRSR